MPIINLKLLKFFGLISSEGRCMPNVKREKKKILKQERMQIRKLQLQQVTTAGTTCPEMPFKI